MKKISYWIRNYFGFSQKEVSGFVILILLILVFLFLPLAYQYFTNSDIDYTSDQRRLDSLIEKMNERISSDTVHNIAPQKKSFPKLSNFDPNKIEKAELIAFGIENRMAERILKFRNKGGKFKVKKDLLKIYDFPADLYSKLEHYILLPDSINLKIKKGIKEAVTFDINLADTLELKSLKGIGNILANRIITYRDKLGGFYSKDQFKEIYGLTPLALEELIKNTFIQINFSPSKINLNSSDVKLLSAHPYIKNKSATIIINYRTQHGSFKSAEDLVKIKNLSPEEINKLLPYLNFD